MSILIGDNFDYRGKNPNFSRDQFETLEEMRGFSADNVDEGHISYCKEDKNHYVFKDGVWKKVNEKLEELEKRVVELENLIKTQKP